MSVFASLLSVKTGDRSGRGFPSSPSFSDFSLGCASAALEEDIRAKQSVQEPSLLRNCSLPARPPSTDITDTSPALTPKASLHSSQSLSFPSAAIEGGFSRQSRPWRKAGLDMYEYSGLAWSRSP
eukprot:gene31758-6956_t